VLWSVANETPRDTTAGEGPRLRFLHTLVDDARRLDSTRLITAALEHRYVDDTTIVIDDPLGKYLDVLGNNEYIGWYDGTVEKADHIVWRSAFDKPLIMSEFGGDGKQGLHGPANQIWTEEYQEKLYQHQVAMLRRIPFLSGMSPWILKDFRSPRRTLPGIQDYFNRKGLVSDKGVRKKAFEVLRKYYQELEH
jgi:beta-glucuronidase